MHLLSTRQHCRSIEVSADALFPEVWRPWMMCCRQSANGVFQDKRMSNILQSQLPDSWQDRLCPGRLHRLLRLQVGLRLQRQRCHCSQSLLHEQSTCLSHAPRADAPHDEARASACHKHSTLTVTPVESAEVGEAQKREHHQCRNAADCQASPAMSMGLTQCFRPAAA